MTGSVNDRFQIGIGRLESSIWGRNFGRAQVFGFLILVTKNGRNTFRQVLVNEIGRQTRKSSEMRFADGLKKRRRNGAAESGMKIMASSCLVLSVRRIPLMRWRGLEVSCRIEYDLLDEKGLKVERLINR
jgi:hypothetical protein